jgi:hypothetical protein
MQRRLPIRSTTSVLLATILIAAGLLSERPALAGPESARFDAAMRPLVEEYLRAQTALAADSDKGVAAAAREMEKLAGKLDAATVKGAQAGRYKELPPKIKTAAAQLAAAKGIAPAREAFKALSRPLALWATLSKPADLNVVFCSMARGSWLQKDKAIRNPYYGAQMLRCGEVVSGPHKGAADGHMKK